MEHREHHEEHDVHSTDGFTPWIDTWWPLLLILFGLSFISTLVFFNPVH